ncbi:unnamed protein product [Heterobilharzia americana]|nr:unnamed protein product [Heterobilharzia americana]
MGRPLQEALESTTTTTSSPATQLPVNTSPPMKVEVLNDIRQATEVWESSRTRWNPTRSTENRRRDNSGHAHTTIGEGLEGRKEERKGTCPLIGRRADLSNS